MCKVRKRGGGKGGGGEGMIEIRTITMKNVGVQYIKWLCHKKTTINVINSPISDAE